jgi:hypothetical protein
VVEDGETTPRRILVLQQWGNGSDLTIYELASEAWESGEYITAMCELAYGTAEPSMLVATSHGRILQYCYGNIVDGAGSGYDFPARWVGVMATEAGCVGQKLERPEIMAGEQCAGNVRWVLQAKRASGDDPTEESGFVEANNSVVQAGVADKIDGRFYLLGIESDAQGVSTNAVTWTVDDIIIRTGRTEVVRR